MCEGKALGHKICLKQGDIIKWIRREHFKQIKKNTTIDFSGPKILYDAQGSKD